MDGSCSKFTNIIVHKISNTSRTDIFRHMWPGPLETPLTVLLGRALEWMVNGNYLVAMEAQQINLEYYAFNFTWKQSGGVK